VSGGGQQWGAEISVPDPSQGYQWITCREWVLLCGADAMPPTIQLSARAVTTFHRMTNTCIPWQTQGIDGSRTPVIERLPFFSAVAKGAIDAVGGDGNTTACGGRGWNTRRDERLRAPAWLVRPCLVWPMDRQFFSTN